MADRKAPEGERTVDGRGPAPWAGGMREVRAPLRRQQFPQLG
jgi:hypothetical protein